MLASCMSGSVGNVRPVTRREQAQSRRIDWPKDSRDADDDFL